MDLPEIRYIAGCEDSTEVDLRAALYCAIGIALSCREAATQADARAAEDRRERETWAEHHAAAREVVRGERDQARGERDAARAARAEFEALCTDWSARALRAEDDAERLRRERDALRIALDAAAAQATAAEADAGHLRAELDTARAESVRLQDERDDERTALTSIEAERDEAHAAAAHLRTLPRIGQPTLAEWAAHRAAGGEWLRLGPYEGGWDCGRVAAHIPGGWRIPVMGGAVVAWPVVATEGGA